jgi:hypothetical protein
MTVHPQSAVAGEETTVAANHEIVRDPPNQTLGCVLFRERAGRRAAAQLLTRDEARRIAANIAKLPELLNAPDSTSARTG